MFGPNIEDVIDNWRKLRSEELCGFVLTPNVMFWSNPGG
jgi:hypothetical protein